MCRGSAQNMLEQRFLKIKAFSVRLSLENGCQQRLPDSLTLYFLPRINGKPLEISGSRLKPNAPAFVTLHRVMWVDKDVASTFNVTSSSVLYCSREYIVGSEGLKYEVYVGEKKVLKGCFRKDLDHEDDMWRMECKCGLEEVVLDKRFNVRETETRHVDAYERLKEAEVLIEAGCGVDMKERVEMVVKKRVRGRRCCVLEEIVEENEAEEEDSNCVNVCRCHEMVSDDYTDLTEDVAEGAEAEMGGVSWAVDVGLWVVCLGVGYLASRATSKSFTRMRIL